jgi:hypothetical protein
LFCLAYDIWVEAMEYFGARTGTSLSECLQAVRRADLYVGVIGTRYGSKNESGISITQLEYEEVYHCANPILFYIIDENNHLVLPKFVDKGIDGEKLSNLKLTLRERHVCEYYCFPHGPREQGKCRYN